MHWNKHTRCPWQRYSIQTQQAADSNKDVHSCRCRLKSMHTVCMRFFPESQNKQHQNGWCWEVNMWHIIMFTSSGLLSKGASLTESNLIKTNYSQTEEGKLLILSPEPKLKKRRSCSRKALHSFLITSHRFPTNMAHGHKYCSLAHLITNTCHLNGWHHHDHLLFDNRHVLYASQNGRVTNLNTRI